jgi:signal transduction histidine kinase
MTMSASAPSIKPVATTISREEHARRIEELGRVILAYSDVTEKLQQSHEQLKQRVESLQQELGEKNRELERRNRLAALGEMAAGLAHEIRNPLGAIRLYVSLLKSDVASHPGAIGTVEKIAKAITRLETIVTGVLGFSREIRATRTKACLAQIVRDAMDTARGSFGERVMFQLQSPESVPAKLDNTLIGQAVLNLLMNAGEAIDGSGRVGIDVSQAEDRLSIRVTDTGPGIPADQLHKIFDPFFTTKDTGTGLGLSIVHRIVEAHEGTITASNTTAGGACFEIQLRGAS